MKRAGRCAAAPLLSSFFAPTIRTLLALFVFLAALFSFVIPPFEAPDEIWHYAFVQHLVTQRALPVAEPKYAGHVAAAGDAGAGLLCGRGAAHRAGRSVRFP